MAKYSNEEIISAIINGQEDVLFYLNRKYFETARRWLRRKGILDSKTPEIFSTILVRVYREIQQSRISEEIAFLIKSGDQFFSLIIYFMRFDFSF